MDVIPAIDIRGGKCVMLYQGDYARETVYSEDPREVALNWARLGAAWIHVVDLDGARSGTPENLGVVADIAASVSVPIQFGGGVRSPEVARAASAAGANRIVVGTAAVEDPDLVRDLCAELGPESVVVGLDARDGYVAVKGWAQDSEVEVPDMVERMEKLGVGRFMYTDVARDGTLTEPNFDAIESLVSLTQARIMAAGGISSVEQLVRLAGLGVDAAIVGKALYTGDVDLREALEAVSGQAT